jgi:pyrroloquinoline quinone biosynthesis protein B
MKFINYIIVTIFILLAFPTHKAISQSALCDIKLVVLGVGQDAGAPQIGNFSDPAWSDLSLRQTATSIAVVEEVEGARYLFEATPHITEQLQLLDDLAPMPDTNLGLDGVFLTHAHIGHYAGLMFFGVEAANTKDLPVYAMPRMGKYIRENGPWSQLVRLNNITTVPIADGKALKVSQTVSVTPFLVPHRDEYSETVGFKIKTDTKSAFFLPDIDSWSEWQKEFNISLEDIINQNDLVFIDATFFDDEELGGRDMSQIPHPRVSMSMKRLKNLSIEQKNRVHFIHYNHTNPIRYTDSKESQLVINNGFNIARAGDIHCLSSSR